MRISLVVAVAAFVLSQGDQIVPVHQEPRHHLVFDSPGTRVLDIQIRPGDTTLFHTHSDPILYVTMSTSRTRNQNHGGEWTLPASAPEDVAAGALVVAPTTPPGRLMSTTSYAEKPQTHRVNNLGPSLFRLIGMTNASAGDLDTAPSAGFEGTPELTNRWFRGYRLSLGDQPTAPHRHPNPVVVVLVAGSGAVRADGAPEPQVLKEPGSFAFVESNVTHTLRAGAPDTQVMEVEIRKPR